MPRIYSIILQHESSILEEGDFFSERERPGSLFLKLGP